MPSLLPLISCQSFLHSILSVKIYSHCHQLPRAAQPMMRCSCPQSPTTSTQASHCHTNRQRLVGEEHQSTRQGLGRSLYRLEISTRWAPTSKRLLSGHIWREICCSFVFKTKLVSIYEGSFEETDLFLRNTEQNIVRSQVVVSVESNEAHVNDYD